LLIWLEITDHYSLAIKKGVHDMDMTMFATIFCIALAFSSMWFGWYLLMPRDSLRNQS